MDFDLNDEQKEIRGVARELLASRSGFAQVRAAAEGAGVDRALAAELVELGWPGIAVGGEHGGGGMGMVELAVLLEEMGYACAPAPLLGTAASAAAIALAGDAQLCNELLPELASGASSAALGLAGLLADSEGTHLALVLGEQGATLVEGAAIEPVATIDPTRRYGSIGADRIAAGRQLGERAAGVARVAIAAEVVGLCQRALDMTLSYVKERKQFDVPVGSFQAVGHRCAEMLRWTESARSATYYAAWSALADVGLFPEAAALAACSAAEAAREVPAAAIQMHGGIGFTWEADVHWLYKRAQLDALLLGSVKGHFVTLAKLAAEKLPAAGVA